jgi:hypothetical protein
MGAHGAGFRGENKRGVIGDFRVSLDRFWTSLSGMSEGNPSNPDKGKWRGEAGIGSGQTGGDHLANNLWLPCILAVALLNSVILTVCRDPLRMSLWLAPVVVFALCAFFARKRSRPLFLLFVFLTAVAGLFAVVASSPSSPE